MSHILRRDQRRISAPASGLSAKSHKGEVPYCYKADAAAGIKQGTSACRGIISPPHAAGICHRLREDGSHTAVKQMASHGESRETVLPAKQIALSIFKSFAYCFGFGAWFYYSRRKSCRFSCGRTVTSARSAGCFGDEGWRFSAAPDMPKALLFPKSAVFRMVAGLPPELIR